MGKTTDHAQELVEVREGDVEALLDDSAWFQARRRKVRIVFGGFVAVALSAVALSMLGDSWGGADSVNVLAQTNVETTKLSSSQITMALAAHLFAPLKKQFTSLAENATDGEAADSNSTAAAAAVAGGGEEKTTDSEETAEGAGAEDKEDQAAKDEKDEGTKTQSTVDPNRPAYKQPDDSMRPGWGAKTGWDVGDWAVWIICGPILTLSACMFVFYSYGWGWAAGTFVALVTVDIFAYYYNV